LGYLTLLLLLEVLQQVLLGRLHCLQLLMQLSLYIQLGPLHLLVAALDLL
jgi:hypothetical protein